jgi:hypothetical protein
LRHGLLMLLSTFHRDQGEQNQNGSGSEAEA